MRGGFAAGGGSALGGGCGEGIWVNTILMVYRMPQWWDCGGAEIAVPLHRRKDIRIKHRKKEI